MSYGTSDTTAILPPTTEAQNLSTTNTSAATYMDGLSSANLPVNTTETCQD